MRGKRRLIDGTQATGLRPGISGGICETRKRAFDCARRRRTQSLGTLGPVALRSLIRRLHREHMRVGGARVLPDLTALTTRHLKLIASELEHANTGLGASRA